jgi:hypothetical protein
MDEQFKVSTQYQLWLERMQLPPEEKLHPEQRKQLKEAFYGAWGQCMLIMRDELSDVADQKGEDAAVEIMEAMYNEVKAYWVDKLPKS